MSESYIKASEAARRIGVSLVTAKRMVNDGRLVGEKVGSRWQVSEQSVFDYLGKDEEEVNKKEVDSTLSTAQNPLELVQGSLDTVDSGGVSSSVVSVGDGDVDIWRAHDARARAIGSETFPEHPGDWRIDQTGPKPDTESDINGTLTELIGTELVPLEGSLPIETSETGDDTPDFCERKRSINAGAQLVKPWL